MSIRKAKNSVNRSVVRKKGRVDCYRTFLGTITKKGKLPLFTPVNRKIIFFKETNSSIK